ncbi:hypothetical protein IV203_024300 [Nitzschia inconspicua]|uniref:Uncharacterized protein n=1 Tax=Nitzschia inconspicua TaxID=303405 RepID=A0A9K3KBL3_9STRA|nr:hypothetical protein IV203_024300 [Nitzschia inconspicua]
MGKRKDPKCPPSSGNYPPVAASMDNYMHKPKSQKKTQRSPEIKDTNAKCCKPRRRVRKKGRKAAATLQGNEPSQGQDRRGPTLTAANPCNCRRNKRQPNGPWMLQDMSAHFASLFPWSGGRMHPRIRVDGCS